MKQLFLICGLLASVAAFAQSSANGITGVSYTLNDGTVVVPQEGGALSFEVNASSTYLTPTKAGGKTQQYSGNDLKEVKLLRDGKEHVYRAYKALGSTTKMMMEELHSTHSVKLLAAMPYETKQYGLIVSYFMLETEKKTPRILPNDDYTVFAASFGCKEVKQQFGKKEGFVSEEDVIVATDLYDNYWAKK